MPNALTGVPAPVNGLAAATGCNLVVHQVPKFEGRFMSLCSSVNTAGWGTRARVCFCLAGLLLSAQPAGVAQGGGRPPLQLFKNYFLSGGDYAVGGVGLRGLGDPVTKLAAGDIVLAGVPPDADISAAFLY